MKALFLTNFFPPAGRGGYEMWCHEVALGLRRRGHELLVLTSRHGRETIPNPDPTWVRRSLHLEMAIASPRNALDFFTKREARERENLALLEDALATFAPDAILVWGMWNLHHSLAALAERRLPDRTIYYFGDYWPTLPNQWQNFWEAPPQSRLAAAVKAPLKGIALRKLAQTPPVPLAFPHALFPSQFMREAYAASGIIPAQVAVVPGGVDLTPYLPLPTPPRTEPSAGPTRLLYAGRLEAEKGVLTAVEAVARLVHSSQPVPVHLDIVGAGNPAYERALQAAVEDRNLADHVTFLGRQPAEEMAGFYRRADIFLFTSIWAEPFGRVIVEAQAAGTAVVGTGTGGSGEIIAGEINGLLFPPGDPDALAAQIKRLIDDDSLRQKLVENGRQTAVERFSLEAMVSGIENYCLSVTHYSVSPPPPKTT